ncbi:carbohydrate sulfotransferase 11-like [Amphibalanus amphitrite]|uniref:carbohydrate sulfotransferase 11-like n=1 Tax=Amphibalanus amphitrite TaxID=1232801 RepID=UPI001C8FD4BC|nr:carbohydrate sulfotransferase 11-like [Amphibalanus amphitrite]
MKCYALALSSVARRSLRKPQLQLLMLLTLLAVMALFTTALQGSWQASQWTATVTARYAHQASAVEESGTAGREQEVPVGPGARVEDQTTQEPPPPPPAPPKTATTVRSVAADGERQELKETSATTEGASSAQNDVAERMAKRMQRRRERIQQVCKQNPKYLAPAITTNVFHDNANAVVWCPVFKAGSSNWLHLLCAVHKLKKKCPIEVLRRHLGNIPRFWTMPKTVRHRFLVVRHPFERLLSAFRDKIENNGRRQGQAYWVKAVKMVRLHRRKDVVPQPVSAAELNGPPPPPPPRQPAPLTFPEFMRSVAAQDVGDEHWKPYFAHCTPCNVDYDLIGKFETLEEDNRYIADQIGIKDYTELLLPQLGNRNKRGPTSNTTREYFSQVTRSELMKVYKMFYMDFLMFNYTVDQYLEYVRPDDDESENKAVAENML